MHKQNVQTENSDDLTSPCVDDEEKEEEPCFMSDGSTPSLQDVDKMDIDSEESSSVIDVVPCEPEIIDLTQWLNCLNNYYKYYLLLQ